MALWLTWPAQSGREQIALHDLRNRRALSSSLWAVTRCGPWSAQGNWGNLSDVTTGWRRVVTSLLAQDLAWGRALASLQQLGHRLTPLLSGRLCSLAQRANGRSSDAGWGRVGIIRAR